MVSSGYAAAKKRIRQIDAGLIRLGEIVKCSECFLGAVSFAQQEAVEADAVEEEDLVTADIAEGAQFAVIAVALAQQARGRVAAAV